MESDPERRDGRVVEDATLEMLCRGNSTVGSNPTLSAIFEILPKNELLAFKIARCLLLAACDFLYLKLRITFLDIKTLFCWIFQEGWILKRVESLLLCFLVFFENKKKTSTFSLPDTECCRIRAPITNPRSKPAKFRAVELKTALLDMRNRLPGGSLKSVFLPVKHQK